MRTIPTAPEGASFWQALPVLVVVAVIIIAMGLFAACGSSEAVRNVDPPTDDTKIVLDHVLQHVTVDGRRYTYVCFEPRWGDNSLWCDRVEPR